MAKGDRQNRGWLWTAKEVLWVGVAWALIIVVYRALPIEVFGYLLLFAALLASQWVRAACSRDERLATMGRAEMMRHHVLICTVAICLGYCILLGIQAAWPKALLGLKLNFYSLF